MNLYKKEYIFDIEADSLLEECTRIHCLSIGYEVNGILKIVTTTDYVEMKKFFERTDITRIAHNGKLYDERVIKKILGAEIDNNIVDTLALSWYLYPSRTKHGLEQWGYDFGIKKPEISDWSNLPIEEYIHRCEEDVKINHKLWTKQKRDLMDIYDTEEESLRLIRYLMFKLECVEEQEDNPLKFDVQKAEQTLEMLEKEKEEKTKSLESVMPKIPKYVTKVKPKVFNKKDGSLSNAAISWLITLNENNLPETHQDPVQIIKNYEEPNANSYDQVKKWLFSLGWIPEHVFIKKDKVTGKITKVPQLGSKEKDGTICNSVKKLFTIEPKLEDLEGLSIISHRIGLFKGFLRDHRNGYIQASLAGLTNTLRLKHKGIVNLPAIGKKYGHEVRSCIIAESDDLLCGSDMSSLEDSTKQHYMYKYDPQYVTEMRTPGFDPHLDIAERSALLTKDESDFYKWYSKKEK